MRKIITILAAAIALATFASSASAGDRYNRHNNLDNSIGGAFIGAIAGVIGGSIVGLLECEEGKFSSQECDRRIGRRALQGAGIGAGAGFVAGAAQPRHYNRVPYYDAGRQRGWSDQPRVAPRLQGYGERVGAGQYCQYRLEYNQWNGRYYCVR